ncbi:MAG: hypothetical protein DMG39_30030 [Acidobacteria bacterium]|nr:MAG: hypothetical protein DMG39_30030 [Acidobacteriota bacterium]
MFRFALPLIVWLYAFAAFAQVETIGDVSFAVPDGWKYEYSPGDDFATMMLTKGDRYWVIAIYKARRSSGDAEADFSSAWTKIAPHAPVPEPIYDHTASAGYSGKYGSIWIDDNRFAWLYLLETGQGAIPVLVVTRDRHAFDDLLPVISQVVEGVRIGREKAQPAKTNVTLADLVGQWHSGGDSSLNYVDSATGSYAGSSIVAHGEGYNIASDGSYTFRFAGISNRQIVRDRGSGTVEVTKEFIVFREKGTNRVTRYRTVSYQPAINGSTVLTLLQETYEPTGANIGFYGEKWVRDAPKK